MTEFRGIFCACQSGTAIGIIAWICVLNIFGNVTVSQSLNAQWQEIVHDRLTPQIRSISWGKKAKAKRSLQRKACHSITIALFRKFLRGCATL